MRFPNLAAVQGKLPRRMHKLTERRGWPICRCAAFADFWNRIQAVRALMVGAAAIRAGASQGQLFWRVVNGPAQDMEENRLILAKMRALGFADPYHVRN